MLLRRRVDHGRRRRRARRHLQLFKLQAPHRQRIRLVGLLPRQRCRRDNRHAYTGNDPANPYARHFCARCGTTLYWKSQNFMPEFTGIAGGCFVDDPVPDPIFSAQDATRCAWVTLPEGMPRA